MAVTSQVEQAAFFGANADLKAIDQYVKNARVETNRAQIDQDNWKRWFDGLSWYTQNVYTDQETLDLARNRRDEFNRDNGVSEEDKNAVAQVQRTGQTLEQAEGEGSRKLSTGKYDVPTDPVIPKWMYWTGAALGVGMVLIGSYSFAAAAPMALLSAHSPRRRFMNES